MSNFPRRVGLYVFCFSFALILYELCLTRILSVLFYYHTAFLAISLAMLGMAAGGLWVYLRGDRFEGDNVGWLLALTLSLGITPFLFGFLRFNTSLMEQLWHPQFLWVFVLVTIVACAPFCIGGVLLAAWFRKYRYQASKLYAWDLAGAAFGAFALVPVMEFLGGLSALFFCSALMGLAAFYAARVHNHRMFSFIGAGFSMLFVLLIFGQNHYQWLSVQVDIAKKRSVPSKPFKKWNAFSRVVLLKHQGWFRGLSDQRREHWKGKLPKQYEALIDINAYAPYIEFDGDFKKVSFLKELVSNVGLHLLPKGQRVAVIGPGGGKDIVSSLLFEPKKVVGIEINPILVEDLLKKKLYNFTGRLVDHPKVKYLVGDGRSVLQGLEQQFDFLMANSVVTWAAHSSGALNLAEHSLYTSEACELYVKRLSKHGILSVSLWDVHHHMLPIRWIHTCLHAAKKRGAKNFKDRVAVIANHWDTGSWFSTILISQKPWSKAQKQRLQQIAKDWSFDLHYLSGYTKSKPIFLRFFKDPKQFQEKARHDISPATDDRPFFLYTARLSDILRFWKKEVWAEDAALANLFFSLILVCVMFVLIVLGPLFLFSPKETRSFSLGGREILYFVGIGLGFMFVEIPLVQRLTLFLGHPTYALTVVLSSILLWSGLGSYWSGLWKKEHLVQSLSRTLGFLLFLLFLLFLGLPSFLSQLEGLPISLKIVVSILGLLPFGLCMGTAFPVGIRLLHLRQSSAIPWAWAINGAGSVVASVAVLWVAAQLGFQMTFLLGFACYALVFLSLKLKQVSKQES